MKKRTRHLVIAALLLLAAGGLRMPLEGGLTRELREQRLLAEPIDLTTRERIGQTSSAVALGGLRSLVSTFLNLRAFRYFTYTQWPEVHQTYEATVNLSPRIAYYWDIGHWNQAYNAASDYLNMDDSQMPALRRRQAWRESIELGRSFLERGVRNMPDSAVLHSSLGFLLSDRNKLPAFRDRQEALAASAEAYRRASELSGALPYVRNAQLRALARVPGREQEALVLARQLFHEHGTHRTPTMLSLLFALESRADPARDPMILALEIFPRPERALYDLAGYRLTASEDYPQHGVEQAILRLEELLEIPPEESALKQPIPPPFTERRIFRLED